MKTPSSSESRFWGGCQRPSWASIIAILCFAATLAASSIVGHFIGLVAGRLLLLAAVGFAIWYVLEAIRDVRRMDELQRRIYLEAAALGCAGMFFLGMSWPALRQVKLVGELPPLAVTFTVIGLFTLGYILAKRRYQ